MRMAAPMPVPPEIMMTAWYPRAAPNRASAHSPLSASFSTNTGSPTRSCTDSRSGSLRQARLGGNSTGERPSSMNPAAPGPAAATPAPLRHRLPQRLVAPGQVGGEQHGGAALIDEPGRAEPDRVHVVPGGELGDHVRDHLGGPGRAGGWEGAFQLFDDVPVSVDDAGRGFGSPYVNADRQAHDRHPPTWRTAGRRTACSAAPSWPTQTPSRPPGPPTPARRWPRSGSSPGRSRGPRPGAP